MQKGTPVKAQDWKSSTAELEVVACPLCRGRRFQALADTDRYDMDVVTVGCLGCGLVLTNPQPTEAALGDFYATHYRRYYQKTDTPSLDYIREYRKDERAAYTTSFLQKQEALRDGMRVLDIGASEGCILKAIRDVVPSATAVAVEPNPLFGGFAVSHAGCVLFPSVEALRDAGEARFDLIVINHVYEHVKQPVDFLRQLASLLAPTGRIYIDVPDVTEYTGLESLHVAHIYHFGPATLRRAAGLAGYAVQVLEKHTPVMHPKSLRCLLEARDGAVAAPVPVREGWAEVLRAQRRADRYHRRRWPLWRRLRHALRRGRSAAVARDAAA
jgi:SAM-dependent methyltransferase